MGIQGRSFWWRDGDGEKYPQIGMYIYMLFCYTLHEYIDNGIVFVGSKLNRSLG